MKVVFIIGAAAVGKMTVGQELAKITDLRLFHNHMSIEPVLEIFGYYNRNVVKRLREVVFEEYAASDNYGMIFTYMWDFNSPSNRDYLLHVEDIFRSKKPDTQFYYAELVASQEERLKRNVSENRLMNKPSKRDIDTSTLRLLSDDKNHRLVSFDGEVAAENYIKIDNTDLSPSDAAMKIKNAFGL